MELAELEAHADETANTLLWGKATTVYPGADPITENTLMAIAYIAPNEETGEPEETYLVLRLPDTQLHLGTATESLWIRVKDALLAAGHSVVIRQYRLATTAIPVTL